MKIFSIIFLTCTSLFAAQDQGSNLLDRFNHKKDIATFPPFSRKDIPELLKIAESTEVTTQCPVNALSSRYVDRCLKGTIALWAIEGIRQGKYPSLNPVLYDSKDEKKDEVALLSEARRKYQNWWARGGRGDPLKKSSLKWY